MNATEVTRTGPRSLIIIGASTGGPRILCDLLSSLPLLPASIIIVQHAPKYINESIVRSLARHTRMKVRLAQDGDELEEGLVLLAPSEVHCRLRSNNTIQLAAGPQVNFVCPSIDVMMKSVEKPVPWHKLVGTLLTGMGRDGAAGLAHIKQLGGMTIVQNQETCAVYGMPAEAVRLGCIDFQLPPERIAQLLVKEIGEVAPAVILKA